LQFSLFNLLTPKLDNFILMSNIPRDMINASFSTSGCMNHAFPQFPTRRVLCVIAMLVISASAFPLARADKADPSAHPSSRRPDFSLWAAGRDVYEARCVVCHGIAGDGKGEMSASLPIKPRSFRQGVFKYRTTPSGKLPTDEDLKGTITGGINGTAMGMFTMLSDNELTAVTEYVKFFSRRWRDPDNYGAPIQFPSPPAWLDDSKAIKEHALRGKTLFSTACAACHGQAGAGNGPAAATLKDTWGSPSPPADLCQPHLRFGSTLGDVYRVLTIGIDGTPMPSFDSYTPAQRWDLVAFIASLRPQ